MYSVNIRRMLLYIFLFNILYYLKQQLQQLFKGMENKNRYVICDALVVFSKCRFEFGGCLRDFNATDRIWEGLKIIF